MYAINYKKRKGNYHKVRSMLFFKNLIRGIFFQTMFDFFSNYVWFLFFYFSNAVILNLIQDLTFFSNYVWFFFIPSLFLLFYKNYYYFSKGRETAQSPKPAVSLPLNPSLFGHGLGRCPKNLTSSEMNSHYNKILVILTQYLSSWQNMRHPELDSGSHSFFFQTLFDFFSFLLFLLCFYFFIKIIITSHRKGDYLRVRSPIVPLPITFPSLGTA